MKPTLLKTEVVMRLIRRVLMLVAVVLVTAPHPANARPSTCEPVVYDNTCVPFIYHAAIPAPTCPTGQTTVSPARWLGSHWSQPECANRPPSNPNPSGTAFFACQTAINQQAPQWGITDVNAATDPPVAEGDGTLIWHDWTPDHYSDWKITWTGVTSSVSQSGNLFSFQSNGSLLVVKGARMDFGVDPGSGTEMRNFVAAVCQANPTTGAVISVYQTTGWAHCGGKEPEGDTGPCSGGH